MTTDLYNILHTKSGNWNNEEELRQGWVIALSNALDIDFHAEREKRDLSYNNVVIEFKSKGLFKGSTESRAFKEAMNDRLLPYIIKISKKENISQSDYIGIAIDGEHICFAQVNEDNIEHGELLKLSETSIRMVCTALRDSYRRSLTDTNLIEDFGHTSLAGTKMMKSLATALSKSLNESDNNKTKMLFEEWRTLFGQVADLSSDQISGINKSLNFNVDTNKTLTIPASLFVIHTFNSLIIKLLAAEIISTHKLTSYLHFAEHLSVQDDQQILKTLSHEIEKGNYFSNAGIFGFVEEALFSWYLDVCDDSEIKEDIVSSIREILIQLSFYRTDNLTEAKSKDLLKLFYQNLVPETLRKTLGEFYTPDWLVSFTIDRSGKVDWLTNRSLDPTCGSGSFLLEIIKRKRAAAALKNWNSEQIISHIKESVWGFDLNPLAVQTARVNYLIAIADLLKAVPGEQIEMPVLLADAIYSPARDPLENEEIVKYRIGSQIADLEITLPADLAFDRSRLDDIFEKLGQSVEADLNYQQVENLLIKTNFLSKSESVKWRNSLENTYDKVFNLHKKNWNGIWFRIIRNFFWSSTAGKFDLIAGNPPWVRWSKLPDLYRERVKPTCLQYNIFSSTPHHGGNELDISGMITYTVADKWLSDEGTLAFIITQTHFQSPSSEGFRDFKINDEFNLVPRSVDDMKELKPFPDATNKTAVAIFTKDGLNKVKYPVKYTIWKAKALHTRAIPSNLSLKDVKDRIVSTEFEANPVTHTNSPWAILPQGRFQQLSKLAGRCTWVQGRKGITADLNGVYFVNIIAENKRNNLVQIKTRPNAGRIDIGPARTFWVEPDCLYPLIKGASDFTRGYLDKRHDLYAFIPNSGIIKKAYEDSKNRLLLLPHTAKYFSFFKEVLEKRSTYKGRMKNAPFYAIYNVGDYTFSEWKVIWAEQKDFCAAVVSSGGVPLMNNKPYIPDHKVFFADFQQPEPAYYLSGLLNSEIVIEYVKSHNISIQIGDIFKHMSLPQYDKKDTLHQQLVQLSIEGHNEGNNIKRERILDKISQLANKIIGVS